MIREFSGGVSLSATCAAGRVAVVRARHEILALPKGHPEAGESMEEAALREVREETGLVAKPVESSAMSPTSTPAGARRC